MKNHSAHLKKLASLSSLLDGEIRLDAIHQTIYSTDASAYREIPLGVAYPRNREDIRKLILFASEHQIPLIPRAAGTSLAGQVVGNGLVVDISRYMTRILEVNKEEHWVRVEPGVILDELNQFVAPDNLFFGPETSTSSRCMVGGMVGNNSCGAHSILYGSTRDHVIAVKALLSDGNEVEFRDLTVEEFNDTCRLLSRKGEIYRTLKRILSDPANQENILREFPDPDIHRRNTGYAIDLLLRMSPFAGKTPLSPLSPAEAPSPPLLNLCTLLAGSEGTLAFITEVTLNLVPLPPSEKALVCVHFHSIEEALKANLIALRFQPGSVELMDKSLLDCTKDNITQRQNRFFIEGDPAAILIVEFARETQDEIRETTLLMEQAMRAAGYGYAFPLVFPPDVKRVWDLRKAGLGVLSNYPGDRKPVAVTEDTAVSPAVLPGYIAEFDQLMRSLGLNCVYHAHVGSGELHLRPVLNLKDQRDVELFHTIALESARLVKKYRGSLSGEHGDGRLRGEFIPLMIGEENYALLKEIKRSWDPDGIFNPGKITDTPKMNSFLRYQPGAEQREIDTVFDFSADGGILRAAERCNGSGDCRNTVLTGRWMCPSYMALKEEQTTTRARANILREFLTQSARSNPFNHPEIYNVMDLCLSCKACKSECPSNVDMTRLKAEFLHQYYTSHTIPLRTWLIANITSLNRLGSILPPVYNFFQTNPVISGLLKRFLSFSTRRSLPLIYKTTLRRWLKKHLHELNASLIDRKGSLFLFIDEFTNYNDTETGIRFVQLLHKLGYEVRVTSHDLSGRTFLSKGLLRKARKIARRNIEIFAPLISEKTPLVGIEPSAILGFRDEYPDLAGPAWKERAQSLAAHVLLYDEFIAGEAEKGHITAGHFTTSAAHIKVHGHCHQKALASVKPTLSMLSIPANFTVEEIPSGCCGMAGSFGYEKEHYALSMKVGELVLFPEVRKASPEMIIAAPGTSCRHQIMDGTGKKAWHPVEILWQALAV